MLIFDDNNRKHFKGNNMNEFQVTIMGIIVMAAAIFLVTAYRMYKNKSIKK